MKNASVKIPMIKKYPAIISIAITDSFFLSARSPTYPPSNRVVEASTAVIENTVPISRKSQPIARRYKLKNEPIYAKALYTHAVAK